MVACSRKGGAVYELEYSLTDVANVCNKEKTFPMEWITNNGTDIGPEFTDYALPLIQGTPAHQFKDGLPIYLSRRNKNV